MIVTLNRAVRVAGADLKPGFYRLVLIERENNQGELCFLAGKREDPQRIAAVVRLRILPPRRGTASASVIYGEAEGVATIAEVRLPTRTLLLDQKTGTPVSLRRKRFCLRRKRSDRRVYAEPTGRGYAEAPKPSGRSLAGN